MNCQYVRDYYNVPACVGRRVNFQGREGTIYEDGGNYISVNFDDQKPGECDNVHPTDEGLQYLGMGKIRKMTAGQKRYSEFREFSDCFDGFGHYLKYLSSYKAKNLGEASRIREALGE